MIKKYLVLGSAPYVPQWYAANGRAYLDDGHQLCVMNNAWKAVSSPAEIRTWFRSEDYFETRGCVPPDEHARSLWDEVVQMQTFPFYYTKIGGTGTILANVLCHLMNTAFASGQQLWVALAGCDMVYTGGSDWFYGEGTPDPLRLGKQRLIDIMVMLKQLSEQAGGSIVNAGGQEDTLLPFARFNINARN